MKKPVKIFLSCLLSVVLVIGIAIGGFFAYLRMLPGNRNTYDFSSLSVMENSPLQDKTVCVLGSSVTHGMAARGKAIAEYLSARFGCEITKEAVIGTTLVDNGSKSYVQRMHRLDTGKHYDMFVCQLSTNDASKNSPLGEIGSDDSFDTSTVTGAMEYIISYVKETWDCPIVFFTNSRFDSKSYQRMVDRLYQLKEKYGIGIIDLWSDNSFNDISDKERHLYMFDQIHPTMAGYRDWWGPELERQLMGYLKEVDR